MPFRVALYEESESEGAMIEYDLPSSLLSMLHRAELDSFGESLDHKMATVVKHAVEKGMKKLEKTGL